MPERGRRSSWVYSVIMVYVIARRRSPVEAISCYIWINRKAWFAGLKSPAQFMEVPSGLAQRVRFSGLPRTEAGFQSAELQFLDQLHAFGRFTVHLHGVIAKLSWNNHTFVLFDLHHIKEFVRRRIAEFILMFENK